MEKKYIDNYKKCIEVWGIDAQIKMCIEEMSELTKALCKLERVKGTSQEDAVLANIKEEIADVLNMAEQLEYYFGEEEIENIRKQKIERTLKKIKGGK